MRIALAARIALVAAAVAAGCGQRTPEPVRQVLEPSLFVRLGGDEALRDLVRSWLRIAAADPLLGPRLQAVPAEQRLRLEQALKTWLQVVTGGAAPGPGWADVLDSGPHLVLSRDESVHFLSTLATVLDRFHIVRSERDELLQRVRAAQP
ncbi:MAG: hypothetical protein U1A78_37095 [Polyangia bacterium]